MVVNIYPYIHCKFHLVYLGTFGNIYEVIHAHGEESNTRWDSSVNAGAAEKTPHSII